MPNRLDSSPRLVAIGVVLLLLALGGYAALRVRPAPARDSAMAVQPTADPQTSDLYLKGLFARNQHTGPALQEAVRYLELAVARDSNLAPAWAALAQAYLLLPDTGGKPADTWRKVQLAAKKALALDRGSAEAYTALAYGNFLYAWDWKAAEENFKRAIAADPTSPTARHWYGDFLAGRGRLDQSLAEMGRAHRLDPRSREIGIEWGWASYLMGKNDEAAAHIRQALALDTNYAPAHLRLGLVRIRQRRYPEAIASLWRAIDLGAFFPQAAGALVAAYAVSGDSSAAADMLEDLTRRSATEPVPPVFIAEAYAGIGNVTKGIEWLNRGIDQKDIYLPENLFDPLLDPLRKDPRFEPVMRRMGLE